MVSVNPGETKSKVKIDSKIEKVFMDSSWICFFIVSKKMSGNEVKSWTIGQNIGHPRLFEPVEVLRIPVWRAFSQ